MLGTTDPYVLHDVPLVADPVAAAIEVRAGRPGAAPAWRQLQRVRPTHKTFPFGMTPAMVHFFGPEPRAEDCAFLLTYDAAGVLRYRIDKEDGEFVPAEIPAEATGRPVLRTSVRLSFDDPAAADRFAAVVDAVQAGGRLPADWRDRLQDLFAQAAEVAVTPAAGPAARARL